MKNTLFVASITLFIGLVSGYTIAQNTLIKPTEIGKNYSNQNTNNFGMHQMSDGSMMQNHKPAGMMGGMNHSMTMVSSEKEFITEMIPHHQEAVNTAKEVLLRGATNPEIKALVENIIVTQEKEISDMKTWYETWYKTPYQPTNTYRPMMRDLSKLNGKELDKTFLEDMIPHHMGAIMMAHSVQGLIEHSEVQNLTSAIITTQSKEIQQMRKMLLDLQ